MALSESEAFFEPALLSLRRIAAIFFLTSFSMPLYFLTASSLLNLPARTAAPSSFFSFSI